MGHQFLTIRTSPALKSALAERAAKEGRSVSALAVRVLEAAAKRWTADPKTHSSLAGAQSAGKAEPNRSNLYGTHNPITGRNYPDR